MTIEQRDIRAPESYLFGLGMVTITPTVEAGAPGRATLILGESMDNPQPVGTITRPGEPGNIFGNAPAGEAAFPEGVSTSLIFENELGLTHLIAQLVTLHQLRYPGRPLLCFTADQVAEVYEQHVVDDQPEHFAAERARKLAAGEVQV